MVRPTPLPARVAAGLLFVTASLACAAREPGLLSSVLREEVRGPAGAGLGELRRALHDEVALIRRTLRPGAPPGEVLAALHARFFSEQGFRPAASDPSNADAASVRAVLEQRRGSCVGLAIVYLHLARRLGLDARAVNAPDHLFVRVHLPQSARNVELLESGRWLDDDVYRRRFRIQNESLSAGVFLRELTDDEVLAHLLSNQAVVLSRASRLNEALARYDRALRIDPRLEAAWYNRGIDLMALGRLSEARSSFDRAIQLHPADAQAHNNRGLTRLRMGDLDGARDDFRAALRIEPALAEAEANLERLESGESSIR